MTQVESLCAFRMRSSSTGGGEVDAAMVCRRQRRQLRPPYVGRVCAHTLRSQRYTRYVVVHAMFVRSVLSAFELDADIGEAPYVADALAVHQAQHISDARRGAYN